MARTPRLQTRYTTSDTRTYGATRMDRDTYESEEEGRRVGQDSAVRRLRARAVQRQRQRVLRGVASSRVTTGHECVSSRFASGLCKTWWGIAYGGGSALVGDYYGSGSGLVGDCVRMRDWTWWGIFRDFFCGGWSTGIP